MIVAEIGINHNGDLQLAKDSIISAAEMGADAVKFQNYITEDFINDRSLTIQYSQAGTKILEPQYDLFKRCELSFDQLSELKELSDSLGVHFQSTPTSSQGINALVNLGCESLKNGSDYLTNIPLIEEMGRTGLPTVLSTGMSTLTEIDTVSAFRNTGKIYYSPSLHILLSYVP